MMEYICVCMYVCMYVCSMYVCMWSSLIYRLVLYNIADFLGIDRYGRQSRSWSPENRKGIEISLSPFTPVNLVSRAGLGRVPFRVSLLILRVQAKSAVLIHGISPAFRDDGAYAIIIALGHS